MLALALAHKEALTAAWLRRAMDPDFRFWNALGGYTHRFEPELETGSWNHLQLVSVAPDGDLLGWLSAAFARIDESVDQLSLANLTGKPQVVFARDAARFFDGLFTDHAQRAIRWTVVVGNPAERLYDHLIERHGGRVVGTERQSRRMSDGLWHDYKHYEILRQDWRVRKPNGNRRSAYIPQGALIKSPSASGAHALTNVPNGHR